MARKKEEFVDDGRVIANMNVDGMPWHDRAARRQSAENDPATDEEVMHNREEMSKLSRKQTFHLIMGVVGAALLVAAVFALGYFLVILLLVKAWT